uniref:RNA helicase n=1 Tax=Vombatus ursinus TaxID=29139 RepID=A0A4X2KB82_VOMUR
MTGAMNLSQPLLKTITAMGFKQPPPIQKACIPMGLLGKDICACTATETGKTAAFAVPVSEHLICKPRQTLITHVFVLIPTQELAFRYTLSPKAGSSYTHPSRAYGAADGRAAWQYLSNTASGSPKVLQG